MGRKQTDLIRQYYKINPQTKEQRCLINNCGVTISNNQASNLRRHLKTKHKEVFTEYQLKLLDASSSTSNNKAKETIKIEINKTELKMACVGLIANGYSYSLFNSRDFRQIIGPISSALGLTIDADSMREEISLASINIKTCLKSELNNTMFSIKIDEATRLNRSLLGINVQYIKDNSIAVKTIALFELTNRHSSEYIQQCIIDTLNSYDLKIEQIYSITCDNGRNMVKASRLIEKQEDTLWPETSDTKEEIYEGSHIENINKAVETIIEQHKNKSEFLGNTIKCAAHTIQLAVDDFVKEHRNVKYKISVFRNLAICLSTSIHRLILINEYHLRQPIIVDNVTRWNTTYNMIESLLECKEYCNTYKHIYKELDIKDHMWNFAAEIIEVFGPIKNLTLQLQREQLYMGDFIKSWLELKICLELIASPMAPILLDKLKLREDNLLQTSVVSAAMYLDPRFNCTMSKNNRDRSIKHLKKLYKHFSSLVEEPPQSPTPSSTSPNINMLLNDYIAEHNEFITTGSTITKNRNAEAIEEIQNYRPQPLDVNTNVLNYWMVKKTELPYLSTLAKIVHAVPVTQCSLERCFSSLKLLLSDQRNNLSADAINDILLVQSNSDFKYQDDF